MCVSLTATNSSQHDHEEQAELFDEHFTDDDFQTTGLLHIVNNSVFILTLLAAQLDIDYLERLNPTSSDEVYPICIVTIVAAMLV